MRRRCQSRPISAANDTRLATVLVLAAAVLVMIPTLSAVAAEDSETGILSLVFENDLFYDTDRHYTHGTRLAWAEAGSGPVGSTPAWPATTRATGRQPSR